MSDGYADDDDRVNAVDDGDIDDDEVSQLIGIQHDDLSIVSGMPISPATLPGAIITETEIEMELQEQMAVLEVEAALVDLMVAMEEEVFLQQVLQQQVLSVSIRIVVS